MSRNYLQRMHHKLDIMFKVLVSDSTCVTAFEVFKSDEERRAHVVRFELFDGSKFYIPRNYLYRYIHKEGTIRRFGRDLSVFEM